MINYIIYSIFTSVLQKLVFLIRKHRHCCIMSLLVFEYDHKDGIVKRNYEIITPR